MPNVTSTFTRVMWLSQ